MPTDSFKVHVFGVETADQSQSLEHVLNAIHQDNLQDRHRMANGAEVRIDDIQVIDGIWLMDFVLARFEGPGRFSPNKQTRDFYMDEDDRFGEESAALFDPETQHLVTQYNHRGVKSGRMLAYFSEYLGGEVNAFSAKMILDPDVEAKLQRMTLSRKLHIGIEPQGLNEADREANLAMTTAAEAEDGFSANHVELTISVQGGRSERLRRAEELYTSIRQIFRRSPDTVSSLKFSGKQAEDVPMEEIDLLGQQLRTTVDKIPIGVGRRMDRQARYNALRRVWSQWKPRLNTYD